MNSAVSEDLEKQLNFSSVEMCVLLAKCSMKKTFPIFFAYLAKNVSTHKFDKNNKKEGQFGVKAHNAPI